MHAMGSLRYVLKAAVVAGLLAGAVTAGFHTLLLEPLIERAIELEEQASQAQGEATEAPVIDRPTQRWGLVLGFLGYGAIWGLFFGLLAYFARTLWPAEWTTVRYGLFLALLVGWSVALLPFLKYPANPPGVGETETIGYRQWLYFGFLGLSVAGTVLAVAVYRWLRRSGRRHGAAAVVVYVIYAAIVFAAMPANPDPVEMPAPLVWWFRVIAFVGLMLFWVVLGAVFGWFTRSESPALIQRRATS